MMDTKNKIVIIGVGQLGSHFLLAARNLDATLKIVDHDKVEMKNTQSQFHTKMGLRRNKVVAMGQAMQGMFAMKVEQVPHKLTADNAEQILGDATLVIDATDNFAAREVIQGFVRKHNIPCLHGSLSADGKFGRIVWDQHFTADKEATQGQDTCEDGETLPFGMFMGSLMAVTVQRFLSDGETRSYHVTPTGIQQVAQ